MKVYLVGGAVRDDLLGVPVVDRDWVVVGATPAEMLRRGYRQVGREFPVFLHPETGEEYALARTERKIGPGYHGFVFDTSREVSIEDDLLRRDLTINAMAKDAEGHLIDPYRGAEDLHRRQLRHVSPAFAEDPVRILRVARFAARYADRDFRVAPETRELMRQMVAAGEVNALVAERVWADMVKALAEPRPSVFIQELRACGALARLFPELDRLYGVPQTASHHPEIDTALHVRLVVDLAARLSEHQAEVTFAALLHDLGKGLTPREEWPRHLRHEHRGLSPVKALCRRLKVPKDFQRLAERVCKQHLRAHRALEMRAAKVHDLILAVDGFRQPGAFERFLLACEADSRGRLGSAERDYPQGRYLRRARDAAQAVSAAPLREQGLEGPALGDALRSAQIEAIEAVRREFELPAS